MNIEEKNLESFNRFCESLNLKIEEIDFTQNGLYLRLSRDNVLCENIYPYELMKNSYVHLARLLHDWAIMVDRTFKIEQSKALREKHMALDT